MAARRWDEARRAFDAAIESDASEASAWINRAALSFARGDLQGALRDLDRVLALGPNPTATRSRARVLERLERA